jgi:hypothetical protein
MEQDLRVAVKAVREQLPRGEERVCYAGVPLCLSWNGEDLFSDPDCMGVPDEKAADVLADFWAELWALRDACAPLTQQQRDGFAAMRPSEQTMAGLEMRAAAFELWKVYGVPWRVVRGRVFRLCGNLRDPLATPYCRSMSVQEFVRGVSIATACDAAEIRELRERLVKWQSAAGVAIICAVALALLRVGF